MIFSPQPGQTGYTISSRHVWLPGRYDTERTARWAFYFPNHLLQRAQVEINIRQQREITRDDLLALKTHLR